MSDIVDLLKQLGQDSNLADEFARDPDQVLSRYDLSEEERDALRAGDVDKIKAITGLQDVRMTAKHISTYD